VINQDDGAQELGRQAQPDLTASMCH
jgi:hypothetical protein